MMNIEQMLAILDPEIVSRLKTAVEIGKWPNGIVLTTTASNLYASGYCVGSSKFT